MISGALAISLVSCVSVLYTASLLPGMLAHVSFVWFYTGRLKNFSRI
ncbi:MAG: hypothetical protein PHR21_07505 [Oscillospiraceae bacterium]|nr:hypothetical protein [Oscillospiraceae bacterium]